LILLDNFILLAVCLNTCIRFDLLANSVWLYVLSYLNLLDKYVIIFEFAGFKYVVCVMGKRIYPDTFFYS
jgi:hypothetical protein